jgi:hypothetical protein
MFIHPLPEVSEFIEKLNDSIQAYEPSQSLSRIQRQWFVYVLMGIIVTGQLCWAVFERRDCFGFCSETKFRWIFRCAKLPWHLLLQASLRLIFKHYGISEGVLAIDDTSKERSKNTTQIFAAHKIKDKKTSGYFNGQELIFMVLVTPIATIPVDFCFYEPDPKQTAWRKAYRQAKRQGMIKKERPLKPQKDPNYPKKHALAVNMLQRFTLVFPHIIVKAVLADALYGCAEFMEQSRAIAGVSQVISQLRGDQLILSKGRFIANFIYINLILYK